MLPNLLHPLHTPGTSLRITAGLHKGQAGILEDFDSASGVYSICLLSNGQAVTVEPEFTEAAKAVTTPEGW